MTTPPRRALQLAEKAILGLITGGAAAIGITEAVFTGMRLGELFGAPATTLLGVPLTQPVPSDVAGATYERVTLIVEGLPGGAMAALATITVLEGLLTVGICASVAWLCLRVFLGKPFVRSVAWMLGILAILIAAAALISPALHGIVNAEAALIVGDPRLPAFLVEIDPAPVGWALALTVIAAAFEVGQRLQHDADGLV